jgi:hypothetical protein
MNRDLGQYIALIAVGSGAIVLGLSYVAAYMVGKAHGRREEQRSSRAVEQADMAQRLSTVESAVYGLNSTIERLMDAQRLLVAQQEHLSRKIGLGDRNPSLPMGQGRNTPS